jgi:hypothetical protein
MAQKHMAQAEELVTEWKEYGHDDETLVKMFYSRLKRIATLEAELAASREQSAQLAAAGEMLKAQVKYGMSVIESEWNTYPDAMDEAVTAWDTALTAWQQGNK